MQYQKYRKRQQKLDKQLAKESEHENEKKVVSYTIRVQQMLNSMGDDDMENFRTGSDGAIVSLGMLGEDGAGSWGTMELYYSGNLLKCSD